ncbi:hypothetical protein SEA_RANA_56 [Streptomyces phage Rana]|nr:hypothetical protein SEA_RANA_56 [Streptomyces phage Rana]
MGGVRRKQGERFGLLTLFKYDKNGYWIVDCDCGERTKKHLTNLTAGRVTSCGVERHPRGDREGYAGWHAHVARQRGPASDFDCVDCGEQARDWSYDHADPNEVDGETTRGHPVKYSRTLEHYEPRCKPCHNTFDNGREAA